MIGNKTSRKISIFLHKLSHKKKNGFNHVVSLGYNCEVAYRFLKYFGFEESSVFNWTYSYSIDDLINTLKHIDNIGKDGFNLPNPLWECKNTHIRFHGKENMGVYIQKKDTPNIRKKDLLELMSRLQYLKEKFIRIAQNNDTKLYIYKLHTSDICDGIEDKLSKLYNVLVKNIKAKNFTLLVVYEKQDKNIKENKNYILRTVKYFAPDNDVTGDDYLDNGWDKIFHEFYQNKKIKNKKKAYKFDK